MSVCGDNTTPISNDSVARVRVPVGADSRRTDYVQWGRPDSEEVILKV